MKFILTIILTTAAEGEPNSTFDAADASWNARPPTHSISPIVYDSNEDCHDAGRRAVDHLDENGVGATPFFRCIPQ